MTTLQDLKDALIANLESRGTLEKLKAQVRTEIFHTLDDQDSTKAELSHENLLINEMIREYLIYNKYYHTLSVLLTESNQPRDPLGRTFLVGEVNIPEHSIDKSRPVMYSLLKNAKHYSTTIIPDSTTLLSDTTISNNNNNTTTKKTQKSRRKKKQEESTGTLAVPPVVDDFDDDSGSLASSSHLLGGFPYVHISNSKRE